MRGERPALDQGYSLHASSARFAVKTVLGPIAVDEVFLFL